MSEEAITYEVVDGVAWLTINRPEARNALNGAVRQGLFDTVHRFNADDSAKVLVLTGAGDHFCAGLDIAELKLFFNEAGSPDDVEKLAREQIRQHESRIADYEDMVARHGREEWAEPRMITIELGLEMEHAALRFWSALANDELDRLRRERAERDPRD